MTLPGSSAASHAPSPPASPPPAQWLEVGGPLGRVPAPEFWMGGEGFGSVRGPRGEPDWTLPISDDRVDGYSVYIMERAWQRALQLHDENQKRARNRFVLANVTARLLQQLSAADRAAAGAGRDPRFFVPPWMRAEQILSDRMEEINALAARLEAHVEAHADDVLDQVVEEHLRMVEEIRAHAHDGHSLANQAYVPADQTPGLDGPRSERQRRREVAAFEGVGLDFLVRVLPGARDVYPELELVDREEAKVVRQRQQRPRRSV